MKRKEENRRNGRQRRKMRKGDGRTEEEREDKKTKIKGAVERKEEKRWLHEVRETTSDTTVIPLVWWVREREKRESTGVNVSVCVQL